MEVFIERFVVGLVVTLLVASAVFLVDVALTFALIIVGVTYKTNGLLLLPFVPALGYALWPTLKRYVKYE